MKVKKLFLTALVVAAAALSTSCVSSIPAALRTGSTGQPVAVVMLKPDKPVWTSVDLIGGVIPQVVGSSMEQKHAKLTNHYIENSRTSLAFGEQIVEKLQSIGVPAKVPNRVYSKEEFGLGGVLTKFKSLPIELQSYERVLLVSENVVLSKPKMMMIPVGGTDVIGLTGGAVIRTSDLKRIGGGAVRAIGEWPEDIEDDETQEYWTAVLKSATYSSRQKFLEAAIK